MNNFGLLLFNYNFSLVEASCEHTSLWLAILSGTVGQRGSDVKRDHPQSFGTYGGIPSTVRDRPTSTGCHGDMAPLSCPAATLLRLRDGVQRAYGFRKTLRGWRRNYGAVVDGVGQLLSHHPGAANYAASVRSSSSGGRDLTEKLWSAYRQAKRRTEGAHDSLIIPYNRSIVAFPILAMSCLQSLMVPQKNKKQNKTATTK